MKVGLAEKPYFDPGKGYHYSNTNTVLLGMIIERVTNNKVEDEFKTRIFDRLGMKNSIMPALASNTIPSPYARGYMFGTLVDLLDAPVLSAEKQAAAKAGTYKPNDVTDLNPSNAWTSGAGISTIEDLARFAKALGEGELLSADMHAKRMASFPPMDPSNPASPLYGLGMAKFGAMYGHNGALAGYSTWMGYDPARKLTVVTWASLTLAPNGRTPADAIAGLIVAELYSAADGATKP